ncbi:MAG TPA: M48 family metalloprotease [Actinomycetota bacterium]|nr:M48 family metalloprotease [Actinomycetota bacterium]
MEAWEEQAARNRNRWRAALLVLMTLGGAAGVGYALGLAVGAGTVGLLVGLGLAALGSLASVLSGSRLVLWAAGARPVGPDEERRLHNVVEGVAAAAGLPKPAVYLVDEKAPNALATGRDPAHASLAVTRGLLELLNRLELEGVVAHELAHVRAGDTLPGTLAATLVGWVVLLAERFLRPLWWGRRRDGAAEGSVLLVPVGLVLALLSPLVALGIRAALPARREERADLAGALLTRYPPGLASALRKVAADHTPMRVVNNATAHLWLRQPSRVPGQGLHWFERLFTTHPPIWDRVRHLEEM